MTACGGRERSARSPKRYLTVWSRGSSLEASPRPPGVQLGPPEPAPAAGAVLVERDLVGGSQPMDGVHRQSQVVRGFLGGHPAIGLIAGDAFEQVWRQPLGECPEFVRFEFIEKRTRECAHAPGSWLLTCGDDGEGRALSSCGPYMGPGRYSRMFFLIFPTISMTSCSWSSRSASRAAWNPSSHHAAPNRTAKGSGRAG